MPSCDTSDCEDAQDLITTSAQYTMPSTISINPISEEALRHPVFKEQTIDCRTLRNDELAGQSSKAAEIYKSMIAKLSTGITNK